MSALDGEVCADLLRLDFPLHWGSHYNYYNFNLVGFQLGHHLVFVLAAPINIYLATVARLSCDVRRPLLFQQASIPLNSAFSQRKVCSFLQQPQTKKQQHNPTIFSIVVAFVAHGVSSQRFPSTSPLQQRYRALEQQH